MVDYDALNAFALELANECGQILSKAFHERDHDVVTKASDVDLVTKTDQLIEKTIMERVKSKYPDHKFIGEEDTATGREIVLTDDITWVIDPVDGTTNFVCGFPYTAVCIGIMENKEPIIGIVNNPIMKELFHARKGKGSTRNGKPIKSKSETKLNKAVVNTEFGSSREPERIATIINNMKKIVLAPSRGIRGLGSAACNICAVAAGQTDAYFETGMHIWDICAAGLILTEAGGVITSTTGGKLEWLNRNIIAADTNELAQEIASRITEIRVDPDGITA